MQHDLPACGQRWGEGNRNAAHHLFVYVWNEFIIAVSLASKQDMRLISVGLYFYLSDFGVEWGKIAAGAMLSLLPPAILFLILQRQLIHGLSAGAFK